MYYDGIVLPHVIDAEGIRIVVENISDDLSGRMRAERLLKGGMRSLGASVICICENLTSAREFVKKNAGAALERTVTLGDALLHNSCMGMVFMLYPALLSGEFRPLIFIGSGESLTEYYLN